jgi:PAS domain S-box-containing protein
MMMTDTLRDAFGPVPLLGTFRVHHEEGVVFWSPSLKAIFGLDRHAPCDFEIFWRLLYRADRKAVITAIAAALSSDQQSRYALEHRIVRPDGVIRWVRVTSRTLFHHGEDSRPVCTVGVVSDITPRVARERRTLVEELGDLHRTRTRALVAA